MTYVTASSENAMFVRFPFFKDGKQCESKIGWGMTLKKAGSMRFRWNETNGIRMRLLSRIAGSSCTPVSLELIHSTTVYDISSFEDTFGLQGDGMITRNMRLLPAVTVADCMPLFLYDSVTGVFGVVHSGWKGTGIIGEAVRLAVQNYGAKPENISIAVGPHIRSCCYIVDEKRASYFRENFCEDCVEEYDGKRPDWNTCDGSLYRLSLEKANLAVLKKSGIKSENIVIARDCTSCNPVFGSFRRETSGIPESEKALSFTVQAAFCGIISRNTL